MPETRHEQRFWLRGTGIAFEELREAEEGVEAGCAVFDSFFGGDGVSHRRRLFAMVGIRLDFTASVATARISRS